MRTYKFQFIFMAISLLVLFSCNKEEGAATDPETYSEVAVLSFGPVLDRMLKRADLKQEMSVPPSCSEAVPAYAQISLTYGDTNIPVDVIVEILSDEHGFFTTYNDKLEIPVASGTTEVSVTLTDFLVLRDNAGSPGDIIWAAPKTGSDFAIYVDQPLPLSWMLNKGSKNYVAVDVICFDDRQANLYGYPIFDITPSQVTTLCFFANYCNAAGRHYTANYSLDLYLGTSAEGTPLYSDQMPVTGSNEEFFANPLCLVVPYPPDGVGADEAYLYYEINLMDWPGYYGTPGEFVETGTLSWNDVQNLLNNDGLTAEYKHIYINCEQPDEKVQDTYVLITVDTEKINENNLNETVFFTDNRSTTFINSSVPTDHVALVDPNKKIFWSGRALNNSDISIEILEVYRKVNGGVRILERTFKDPNYEGVIIGEIRPDYVDGFELYNLSFKISGVTERTFTVDPKLKMIRSIIIN